MSQNVLKDLGPHGAVVDVEAETLANSLYRVTRWTGVNLQMTYMCIQPGHDIGLEVHEDHDQFLRIEQGRAEVALGPAKDQLELSEAAEDDAVFVPAGTWHNLTNTGDEPLKLYSIYAPPEHAHGTVHHTKEEADAAEAAEGH